MKSLKMKSYWITVDLIQKFYMKTKQGHRDKQGDLNRTLAAGIRRGFDITDNHQKLGRNKDCLQEHGATRCFILYVLFLNLWDLTNCCLKSQSPVSYYSIPCKLILPIQKETSSHKINKDEKNT